MPAADNAKDMAKREDTTSGDATQATGKPVHPECFVTPRKTAERSLGGRIELHVCPRCESELVEPIDWSRAGARRWAVSLRCPECDWSGTGTYPQAVVERFEETLEAGVQSILDDLNLLARANMEDQIEAFSTALQRDYVLPEDF